MHIHSNFPGGNVALQSIEQGHVFVERELRDSREDWFYWAFCVEGAENQTLAFHFPSNVRVGRFGPAVSGDLLSWRWLDSPCTGDSFTYTFGADEHRVYFAHHQLYPMERFPRFCEAHHLPVEALCLSRKHRPVPGVRWGDGEKWVVLTSRHHACESTGTYVLEGALESLLADWPKAYSCLVMPFVDYDGVLDGDQGKNRAPHDHNRDYIPAPLYPTVACLQQFARTHQVAYACDFHSPWHQSGENDHVFLVHTTGQRVAETNLFGALFREETATLPLRYDGQHDSLPNVGWNKETSPTFTKYFGNRPDVKLVTSLETPYFGLKNAKVSQESLLTLGRAYGRALLRYIVQDDSAEPIS